VYGGGTKGFPGKITDQLNTLSRGGRSKARSRNIFYVLGKQTEIVSLSWRKASAKLPCGLGDAPKPKQKRLYSTRRRRTINPYFKGERSLARQTEQRQRRAGRCSGRTNGAGVGGQSRRLCFQRGGGNQTPPRKPSEAVEEGFKRLGASTRLWSTDMVPQACSKLGGRGEGVTQRERRTSVRKIPIAQAAGIQQGNSNQRDAKIKYC